MESSQLKNIQNIENSLVLLQSKIEKMYRLDSRNQDTLLRLKESTIPIVQKKQRDSRLLYETKIKQAQYCEISSEMKKKNQESRLVNEKELSRSKQLLSLMKHHNSLHLKQAKKTNQEKIHKIKELKLTQKKSQTNLVKMKQQEAQAKIQQFHQRKQIDLRLRRECEQKQNEQKMKGLLHKMKQLAKTEKEMEEKVKMSQQNINKVKKVIRKVDKMKCDQFLGFKESITPTLQNNSKSVSEAIIQYATRSSAQKAI